MTFWSEDIECQSIGIIFRILIYITNGEVFLLHNHNMFAGVWMGGRAIEGSNIIWCAICFVIIWCYLFYQIVDHIFVEQNKNF